MSLALTKDLILAKARAPGLRLTFQDKNSNFGYMGERRPSELQFCSATV